VTVTHGFIDESVRSDGWYRLTMVEVSARDLGSVTRALRSMLPDGRQRLHFSSEGDARRRQILTAMTRLPISATTIGAPYRRGRDEEPARQRCLIELLAVINPTVAVLVLDSRGVHRDLNDRRVLRGVMRASGRDLPAYSHRGSSDEPLLALPDALGWAVGAGGHFAKQVALHVREIFLSDQTG